MKKSHHIQEVERKKEVKDMMYGQDLPASIPWLIELKESRKNDKTGLYEHVSSEYFCNADKDIDYDGHTYLARVFKITPPEVTTTSVGNAKLSFTAIDQQWIRRIRSADRFSRYSVVFTGVVDYTKLGERHVEPLFNNEFKLKKAGWTELVVSWDMVFDDNMDILCPCQMCTLETTIGVE